MTNKKKNLIEALHGSYMFVANLPDLIDRETIYDKTGHVDTEFLTAILEFMSRMANLTNDVNTSLARLLGIDGLDETKEKKSDNGSKLNVEEILKLCTLENNIMKLPNIQLNKKSFLEAKKWIEEAGGSWIGGKIQGFSFPFNPKRVFSILSQGKRCNLQQDFQFFETPHDVADWLVVLAGGINEWDSVLEPSAGRGALIKAIHRSCSSVIVDCCEMMPENKEILSALGGINIIGDDFTKLGTDKKYSKIIANPPFSKNQDIDHVRIMYDKLKDGGTMAVITSTHWVFSKEKKCVDFQEWIDSVHGRKYEIDNGAFKESGTTVKTIAIVINKE